MQTATVQMCSSPDVAANLASAHALLTQAAAHGAELAVLPEYFCGLWPAPAQHRGGPGCFRRWGFRHSGAAGA